MGGRLYHGDNLEVMGGMDGETVDLIYADPPFGTGKDWGAFDDRWQDAGADGLSAVARRYHSPAMAGYVAFMEPRLRECRRVLKPTGSIYLHCDPTASHYLKVLCDAVFGPEKFRNEIAWRRSNPKSLTTINFPNCRDTILRYSRESQGFTFHMVYGAHDPEYERKHYRHSDAKGRYQLLPLSNPNDNRPNLTYEFLGVTRVWRWTRERMQKAYQDGIVVQTNPGTVPRYKQYLHESQGRTVTNDWHDIGPCLEERARRLPYTEAARIAAPDRRSIEQSPATWCWTRFVVAGRRWWRRSL